MADIDGDGSDNTISGTTGSDNIEGKGGQDTLDGNGGSDIVSGGDGDDNIDGGAGNDIVFGGDGNDVITGGSGNDIIVGGRGDDTMSAGNGSTTDTFVIRDGDDGHDTITDFDAFEPDIIRFNMAEISTFQDVMDRITTQGSDTIINYDNGFTTRLVNTDPNDLSSTNFEMGSGPVCLSKGTYIDTPTGPRLIESLEPGDLVTTLDHGPQPIVQMIAETVHFRGENDRRKPILVSKGALGQGKPIFDIVASPQHRFVLASPATNKSHLVAAVKLTRRKGIRRMKGRKQANYFNLLMDKHEIIFANGCAVETLLITPNTELKLGNLNVTFDLQQSGMQSARPIAQEDPFYEEN